MRSLVVLIRQADYPNQNAILDALNHQLTRTDYAAAKATLQKEALKNGVLRVMEEGRLDAIVGPTDGPLASISAAIGKKAIGSGWQVLSLTRI